MRREVVIERDFLLTEHFPEAVIRQGLVFVPGDAVTRFHPVTGKPERWVLLNEVRPAEDFHTDQHHDDWMRGRERFLRKQRWEAAFVTSVHP